VSPRRARRGLGTQDGFTAIEMLISMMLMGFVFAAFSLVISSTLTHSAQITSESVIQTQARAAVAQLSRDLRQAFPPSTTATSPFVTTAGVMSPTSITFYSPDETYSGGSPATFHLREISYQLTGGQLQRRFAVATNTNGPPWTMPAFSAWVTQLSGIVNTDIFTYYDGSNPPVTTTDPAAVRTAVIKVTVMAVPDGGKQSTFSDSSTLRVTSTT
jgi:prepilin-type N-terminal cleavage/methylation domain-containing protein